MTRELTNAEFCRLSQVLGDTNLSNDAKKMRIAGMVNTIVMVTQQASQNYEQVLEQQEGQKSDNAKKAVRYLEVPHLGRLKTKKKYLSYD